MDVWCPKCGEVWDHDELHGLPMLYPDAVQAFREYGCGLFEHAWNGRPLRACTATRTRAGVLATAVYESHDGDMDAAAAFLAGGGWLV